MHVHRGHHRASERERQQANERTARVVSRQHVELIFEPQLGSSHSPKMHLLVSINAPTRTIDEAFTDCLLAIAGHYNPSYTLLMKSIIEPHY